MNPPKYNKAAIDAWKAEMPEQWYSLLFSQLYQFEYEIMKKHFTCISDICESDEIVCLFTKHLNNLNGSVKYMMKFQELVRAFFSVPSMKIYLLEDESDNNNWLSPEHQKYFSDLTLWLIDETQKYYGCTEFGYYFLNKEKVLAFLPYTASADEIVETYKKLKQANNATKQPRYYNICILEIQLNFTFVTLVSLSCVNLTLSFSIFRGKITFIVSI